MTKSMCIHMPVSSISRIVVGLALPTISILTDPSGTLHWVGRVGCTATISSSMVGSTK